MRGVTKVPAALSVTLAFAAIIAYGVLQAPETALAGGPAGGDAFPVNDELAELGDEIFDDANLSLNRNQACSACHAAEWGFTGPASDVNAHGAVYEGSIAGRFGDRKPPSSAYSTLSPVFHFDKPSGLFVGGNFWDGRATGEKLGNPAADQAQGPFLNPFEQALRDPACVVYRVSIASYSAMYKEIWGTAIDTIVFPSDIDAQCAVEGRPFGFDYIDLANRAKISQEYDNIAISIAVYEDSRVTNPLFSSKFDAMRKGLYRFTEQERRGFALFQGKGKCVRCHTSNGQNPVFTDHTYDNLGVPANPENPIYNRLPDFVDWGLGGFLETRPEYKAYAAAEMGKMRVPTLRNVDLRPTPTDVKAYMHNGVFKSLQEVVRFYNTRDVLPVCGPTAQRSEWGETCWPKPEVAQNVNTGELGDLGLTREQEGDLVAFPKTLNDGFIPNPRGRR